MAYFKNVNMSDGGGRKKDPLISQSAKEAVDDLHAGENIRGSLGTAIGDTTKSLAGQIAGNVPAVTGIQIPPPGSSGGGESATGEGGIAAQPGTVEASPYRSAEDKARSLYEQSMEGRPDWKGSAYDDDIDALYAKITGRGDFSYDLNKDALWQQYRDEYMRAGKQAMTDTMGRAAALTGGYGSSYGQAVGQQAYDRRMEDLMDIAPELYEKAYGRYRDEGEELQNRLGLARTLAGDDYDRWRDSVGDWRDERDTAWSQYLTERAYADDKESEAFGRITSYISLGYTPTAQELADAGITPEQYAAIAAAYAPKKSGGGGGSPKKSAYDQALADMQEAIKAGADQYEINTAIAANTSLTTEERRKLMDQNTAPISSRYIWDK